LGIARRLRHSQLLPQHHYGFMGAIRQAKLLAQDVVHFFYCCLVEYKEYALRRYVSRKVKKAAKARKKGPVKPGSSQVAPVDATAADDEHSQQKADLLSQLKAARRFPLGAVLQALLIPLVGGLYYVSLAPMWAMR
jgi:hypothetical protein